MIENLYAKYLLADRLNKIAEKAGVHVDYATVRNGESGIYQFDIQLQCSMAGKYGAEANELAAVMLLDALPALNLVRSSGLIYLNGVAENGLTFSFYTGTGVCERVQVGTRHVEAMEAYDEPVYKTICADPLSELVSA